MEDKTDSYKLKLGDKELVFKLSGLADQASGYCLAQIGDTSVLTTAQIGNDSSGLGFFPLTVDFEEKFYAAGKILGSRFIRREGRPSINSVLAGRMIDRATRPLFPKELKREVQVIATCLSFDGDNDPVCLALLGASLALGLSEIPWQGPVAAVRIGKKEKGDDFILNPSYGQRESAYLDIVFAGVEDEKEGLLINMIDGQSEEAAESDIVGAVEFASPYLKQLLDFQNEIIKQNGKEEIVLAKSELDAELVKKLKRFLADNLEGALYEKEKQKRNVGYQELEEKMLLEFDDEIGDNTGLVKELFLEETERVFRANILQKSRRPDGRELDELRKIDCQVAFLPRTHGSAIFTRGKTRILSILTLGSPGDQQLLEGMDFSGKKRFLHHYNFPPYSVGEVRRLFGPGRREIGHGMLAEKSLLPLIPSLDDFPYTIGIV